MEIKPLSSSWRPKCLGGVAVLTVKSFGTKYETFKKTLTVIDEKDDNLEGFGFCPTRRTLRRSNANRNGGKRLNENGLRGPRFVIEKRVVRVVSDSREDRAQFARRTVRR